MTECTNCGDTDKPVYRTQPKGVTPARWMCKECVRICFLGKKEIPANVLQIVKIICGGT